MILLTSQHAVRRQASTRGFTLVELLVVISIIGVLAGILLPVVNRVIDNARKAQAKAAESQIVGAINSYQSDYGSYPVAAPAGGTPTDVTFNDGTGNVTVFDVLRARNNDGVLNVRRISYFEGTDAKSKTSPRGGFVPTGATPTGNPKNPGEAVHVGDFLDPWGNEYCIRMDSGNSNQVKNPYAGGGEGDVDDGPAGTAFDANSVHTGVIVWCHGADGVFGSTSSPLPSLGDDVTSWQ